MPKTCNADGCNNPVFGKGFCRSHQYLRTDKKKPKPIRNSQIANSLHKKCNTKSVKKIKHSSSKRMKENALYEQAKIEVREMLQEKGEWKCFFTLLDIPDDIAYWHHALGKEGPLLYDKENIYPVNNQAHSDYHHREIKYLLENTDWYITFIKRMYMSKPDVFIIESRRMMRSGLGLKYLSGFFGDLINEINKH